MDKNGKIVTKIPSFLSTLDIAGFLRIENVEAFNNLFCIFYLSRKILTFYIVQDIVR